MLLLALLSIPVSGLGAEPIVYSTGFGFEYSTGRYGTDTKTESVFVPLTAYVYFPSSQAELSLEIPYVYQKTRTVTTTVFRGGDGVTGKAAVAAMGGSGMMGDGSGQNGSGQNGSGGMGSGSGMSGMTGSEADAQKSAQGMGDVTARAGFVLIDEGDVMPRIRPSIYLKFPTADREKGLGTGEHDGGIAVNLSKWLGDCYAYAEAGYNIQGKTPYMQLKNYASYNAGIGYQIGERLRPMLVVKGATAPVEGSAAPLEARIRLSFKATGKTGMDAYIAKGLSDGSPDYGTGLSVFMDF
ncbi:MAG: transporter [Nitrospirae bacterium]|nr:transporter [Nitrospirota bacterium]